MGRRLTEKCFFSIPKRILVYFFYSVFFLVLVKTVIVNEQQRVFPI